MSVQTRAEPVIACNLDDFQVARLSQHQSNPLLLPYAADREVWDVPPEANILFTFARRWQAAPTHAPRGWPFNLEWVQVAATGVDSFPPWLFDAPQVTIGRGIAADAIAEYVIAAVFAHDKLTWDGIRVHCQKDWRQQPLRMIAGKKLGVLGYGSIGVATARLARAVGMQVSVARRSTGQLEEGIARYDTVDDLIANVDHLVLAVPLTSATRGMINQRTLSLAKPGLHIINVCRGAIIDDEALLEALEVGRVAAATLDVTNPEPLPDGHAFYANPRVRLTPHISWTSEDSADRIAERLSSNLDRFLRGEALRDVADAERGY